MQLPLFAIVQGQQVCERALTCWRPSVPLTTLLILKLWTRALLTELNFYSPAAGKSKKRKKDNFSIFDPEGKIMAADGGTSIHGKKNLQNPEY